MPSANKRIDNNLRLCLRLIAAASLIAPKSDRAEWKREWEAEVHHRWILLRDWNRLDLRNAVELLTRCLGAFSDAAFLRSQSFQWISQAQELLFESIRRRPAPAFAAIIALSIGIAAGSLIFSLADKALLHPLPFEDSDRLIVIRDRFSELELDDLPASMPEFSDYKSQSRSFEALAAFHIANVKMKFGAETDQVGLTLTTPDLFSVFGGRAALGELFPAEIDTAANSDRIAVLSFALWRRRFKSDPDVINKRVDIEGRDYQIVGVMPEDFAYPSKADLWTPVLFDSYNKYPKQRAERYFKIIGRLKNGVSLSEAQADMDKVALSLQQRYPNYYGKGDMGWGIAVKSLGERTTEKIKPSLLVLFASACTVFLFSCIIAAGFLTTASECDFDRFNEKLETGRSDLLKRAMAQSGFFALMSGAAAVPIAICGMKLLIAANIESIPRLNEFSSNNGALGFAAILTASAGLICGLVPISANSKTLLQSDLPLFASTRTKRIKQALTVFEFALAAALITAAGFMIDNLLRQQRTDPGFDAKNLLILKLSPPKPYNVEERRITALYKEMLERARRTPGIEAAAVIDSPPFSGRGRNNSFIIKGKRDLSPTPSKDVRIVSESYFETMRMPLLLGRFFTEADDEESAPVAIISEAMVRRFWKDEDPIGKKIKIAGSKDEPWREIVGIVGDVREYGLDEEAKGEIFLPHTQYPVRNMTLAVRMSEASTESADLLRKEIIALDNDWSVYDAESMERVIAQSLEVRRISTLIVSIFAAIASVLSARMLIAKFAK